MERRGPYTRRPICFTSHGMSNNQTNTNNYTNTVHKQTKATSQQKVNVHDLVTSIQ